MTYSPILGPLDHLTLREQLKLLEIANEGRDHEVRAHALSILTAYRHPPVPCSSGELTEGAK